MTDIRNLSETKKQVIDTVREAGELLLSYYGRKISSRSKGGLDFATVADDAVDKFLREKLAAKFPSTKLLSKKNITLIPDILANAGGVAVSYYEWYQNINHKRWSKKFVFRELRNKMERATDTVYETAKENNVTLRTAAYIVAIKRLEKSWHSQKDKIERKSLAESMEQYAKRRYNYLPKSH